MGLAEMCSSLHSVVFHCIVLEESSVIVCLCGIDVFMRMLASEGGLQLKELCSAPQSLKAYCLSRQNVSRSGESDRVAV